MKHRTALKSLAVILVFIFSFYGRQALQTYLAFDIQSPIIHTAYYYAWWIVPTILATGLLFGFQNIFRTLGLRKGFLTGLTFAGICTFPMFASSAFFSPLITNTDIGTIFQKTFVAGFMEELVFRGFLFGLLFRKLKWGFLPAAVPGAVIFGFGHIYQGSGFADTLGIFLVTFIGAAWFSWLYAEWNFNLWVPVWLHILMNLAWAVFEVSNNALGGWAENIFRVATITLTVIITIIYCKRRKQFAVNRSNLITNKNVH